MNLLKSQDLINKGIGTNASLEEINKLIQDIKKQNMI